MQGGARGSGRQAARPDRSGNRAVVLPRGAAHGARRVRGVLVLSVRDEGSRDLLQEAGVAAERITLSADAAFLLRAERIRPEDILMATGVEPRAPIAGVALRPWLLGVDQERLEREIAGALDRFVEETGALCSCPVRRASGPRRTTRASPRACASACGTPTAPSSWPIRARPRRPPACSPGATWFSPCVCTRRSSRSREPFRRC